MEQNQPDKLTDMHVQIDEQARLHLQNMSKWTKFLSVLVFVGCGLAVIGAIAAGSTMINVFEQFMPGNSLVGSLGGVIAAVLAVVALLVGFIYYFLFQFSVKVKSGLATEQSDLLVAGLNSMRTFFTITVILGAVSIFFTLMSFFIS